MGVWCLVLASDRPPLSFGHLPRGGEPEKDYFIKRLRFLDLVLVAYFLKLETWNLRL